MSEPKTKDGQRTELRPLKDHPLIRKVAKSLRVTKVVCTRSVKGKYGDHYVGFSAAWDSSQDDAGGAADLITLMGEGDEQVAAEQAGLTLKEAKIASLILGMQADRAAHQNAWAGGSISQEARADALTAINNNYMKLLLDAVNDEAAEADSTPTRS